MSATTLCDIVCHLGEGPTYDTVTNTVYWFDILERRLLEKAYPDGETIVHDLPLMASALFRIDAQRQLVWTETLLLCTTGGVLGIALALALSQVTEVVIRNVLPYSPKGGLVLIDTNLVLFTLGAISVIGLLSGLYPAWQAGRIRPLEAIRSGVNE